MKNLIVAVNNVMKEVVSIDKNSNVVKPLTFWNTM